MKGRNAIKRQYKAGDLIGGGTWFWAGPGIDNGEICEQELVMLDVTVRPSDYYKSVIIPLMVRTLGKALLKINGKLI
jgi:folate-dependent phosphoribosylglycinamide formyltransferase PurN